MHHDHSPANFTRRLALGLLLGASALSAWAQADYPNKPIRLIVTFPPGGSADAVVRLVAPRLGERLGQTIVVENRPGAGGNIGLAAVAQSPADGYTLGVGAAGALSANASLYAKMPYDVAKDFAPVSLLAHIPFVLAAHPSFTGERIGDVLARSKAAPGSLAVGHGGNGTAMHLSIQLLKQMGKVELTEVAYKGSGPAAVDVLGGQIPLALVDLPSALAHIRAGKLKALGVTSEQRLPFLPEVPTLAESGVTGYVSTGWFGVVAPAATPPAALAKLQAALVAVLAEPAVVQNARTIGVELAPTTAAAFGGFIRSETTKWADVIRTSGTKLE